MLHPAPFILRPNLLNERARAGLWAMIERDRERFRPSTLYRRDGRTALDRSRRISLSQGASPAVRRIFLSRLRQVLAAPGLLNGLGLDRHHAAGEVSISITSHLDGAFFTRHTDSDRSASTPSTARRRVLSFVYYIHRTPARWSGGDLLLFDETTRGSPPSVPDFTRIVPADNLLVCFPPSRPHEVTPVCCGSDDVLDGRLTVNGWLLSADTAPMSRSENKKEEEEQRDGAAQTGLEAPTAD
jgi:Rps23 Pro-64 3,4-dihydroxylase Tpa1-like proline 4-hydroxylase